MEILKNVQTILGILFEHIEGVMLVIAICLTAFNVIFNIVIRNQYRSQINKGTNQKEEV